MEFFRHCPECGRRFHIQLVDKKAVHLERRQVATKVVVRSPTSPTSRYGLVGFSTAPLVMMEGKPIIVDVEEFQYNYKCGHCGHVWSERHVEEHRES